MDRWLTVVATVMIVVLGQETPAAVCDELSTSAVTARDVDFPTQIRPLLSRKCGDCHGEETQESGLRVDRRASLLRGGDSGEPAMLPGDSGASHLIHLVERTDPDQKMPPDDGDRLSADEIRLLKLWIDQGAPWSADGTDAEPESVSDHWSFQAIADVVPPELNDPWIRNPIDAFVLQELSANNLQHSEEAAPAVLMRRVWLDMLGLPPNPEEVSKWIRDPSPTAYEQLIDRVLASPHYGERWASYWLDLVRFSETNGFETNRERPNAWPYRDYVIQSLNDDKPYDQFVREQIAGDVLGAPVGTGFLVAGPYDLVKSPDVNLTLMQRANELDDMVNTTGTALMGLTLGCARCHNHKFDPVRQSDYYSVQAIFAGVQHGEQSLPPAPQQQQQLADLDQRLSVIRKTLEPLRMERSGTRPPVNAKRNEERFEVVPAKFVRFTIRKSNAAQPCLDELEIFSDEMNVALASRGAVATCSSALPGFEIHQLQHINDGLYGNSHSWISNEPGTGWVQIEFPSERMIDRVVWGRDREGHYRDRLATDYQIAAAVTPGEWTVIASSDDRRPFTDGAEPKSEYSLSGLAEPERAKFEGLISELNALEEARRRLAESSKVYAGSFSAPPVTRRLFRGEPSAPREVIEPNTVEILGRLQLTSQSTDSERRRALAEWITSPQNPLTSRVIVNRIWQFHFGRGLVGTPSDFGAAGLRPSHPELLEWLAAELIRRDWSLKQIHRLILESAVYRQSSRPDANALKIDADNQWLWRFSPRRLEAEAVRDSILSVSGVLDLRAGGPGFSAFEIEMENVRHYFPKKRYGSEDWRRMIYMTRVRLEKDSVFGVFDCPDGASSVPKRTRSTTPLQALNLFNSEFMLQQSELFAERLQRDATSDPAGQVHRAFWLCGSRAPNADELAASQAFISTEGLSAFCRAMLNSNEFLFLP